MSVFSLLGIVTYLFYSMRLKKILLSMIYPNLKNFSLFDLEICSRNNRYNNLFLVDLPGARRS